MTAAEDRLSAAKLWLTAAAQDAGTAVGDAPYLATAVYTMPTILTSDVGQLTADDRWRLYANPDVVEQTPVPELAAQLAHLCWHLLHDHAGRARSLSVGSREAAAWRKAADATVRETLDAAGHPGAGLGTPAELGLPSGRSAEELYALLDRLSVAPKPTPDTADCQESGCGSAADGLRRPYEAAGDTALDASRAQQVRAAVAVEYRGHMTGRGAEPGEWARRIRTILSPTVAWQQVLAAAIRRALGWTSGHTTTTYSRLSRRAAASPQVVFPGLRRPRPDVAVVVDTSGSMDDGLLAQALGEVDGVLRSLGPGAGAASVLSCDATVHTVQRVLSVEAVQLVGGGGTDLVPGIIAALSLHPRPDVVVVLTDGFTPWPRVAPPGCAVVAALLGRQAEALPTTPRWVTRVECVLG